MLLQKFILGVVVNIQHVILSTAASLDSDLQYDDFNLFGIHQDEFLQDNSLYTDGIGVVQRHIAFQNSQSEEDPFSSSEELQSHLDHRDDLVVVDLDEGKSNLDYPLDNQDYDAMVNSDEDNSNLIQILIGKKKTTVNTNTPVLVDTHHFMGLEKVLEEISKMLNLAGDKEGGIYANNYSSSEIQYRYMQRIPKYLNIKDSEEENEFSEVDDNYKNGNYYENDEIHSLMLHKQYPFLYTLHNMNNNGSVDESTGNMNKEQPLIQELGTIVSTEQTIIHLYDVSNFEHSNTNPDNEPYMISEQIDEKRIPFALDQSKDNYSMESQNIYGNQRQNLLFALDQMAPTNIDELQAISPHRNDQQFQLEDINSHVPGSETLVQYETFNDVLVNGGSQNIIDGDFVLEELKPINEPVAMFADGEMFTLDEIETQLKFESNDSQNFILESSEMNDKSALKLFVSDELHTSKNDHIFTLEEFVSDMHTEVNNLVEKQNIVFKDIVFSNLTSSANQEIISHDNEPTTPLDEQSFVLETSTSLNDLFHLQEKPLIYQLATNKIVTNVDNQIHIAAKAKSSKNDLPDLDKEPIIYSLMSNENTVNLVDPIKYESTSSAYGSYQIHVHKEPQLIALHSKEINTHSANQLTDKFDIHSSENSDNSKVSNLVVHNAERKNHKNENVKLTNGDQQSEYHVFHLDPSIGDLKAMPVENISNHYEIKNNNKSYYLIKVEKRPDKNNENLQNQSKSSSALDEKQEPLTKDLLTAEQSENISNDDQLLKENKEMIDEFPSFSELDLYFSNEKDINYKESRIFLTLDDVVDVLSDKFSDMLKTL